jgi:glycosyltransferase involved in cell wall biosynthesis
MADVAVCVTVFKRIEKLNTLLRSIDSEFVSTVYVADDGEWTDRKEEVYDQSFPFDLEVFNMEFDAGLGAGRHRIVQEYEEDYLLLMDSDMQMPENVHILSEQLEEDSTLGGVCGVFVEDNRVYTSGCMDIYEENSTCKLEIRDRKEVEFVANYPFVEFDMIANGALFRRECLEDYCWDPEYVIGREHVDFYVGHKHQTDWKFGLSPSVLFPHDPGGGDDFLTHRWDDGKYNTAHRYFMQKWGYDEYEPIRYSWIDTYDPRLNSHPPHSLLQKAKYKYEDEGAISLFKSIMKILF